MILLGALGALQACGSSTPSRREPPPEPTPSTPASSDAAPGLGYRASEFFTRIDKYAPDSAGIPRIATLRVDADNLYAYVEDVLPGTFWSREAQIDAKSPRIVAFSRKTGKEVFTLPTPPAQFTKANLFVADGGCVFVPYEDEASDGGVSGHGVKRVCAGSLDKQEVIPGAATNVVIHNHALYWFGYAPAGDGGAGRTFLSSYDPATKVTREVADLGEALVWPTSFGAELAVFATERKVYDPQWKVTETFADFARVNYETGAVERMGSRKGDPFAMMSPMAVIGTDLVWDLPLKGLVATSLTTGEDRVLDPRLDGVFDIAPLGRYVMTSWVIRRADEYDHSTVREVYLTGLEPNGTSPSVRLTDTAFDGEYVEPALRNCAVADENDVFLTNGRGSIARVAAPLR